MVEDRKLAVLRAIVEDYVSTQEPVGSKALVERHQLGVSPATVRNDMAALEEEGFITQPHTSAGRIPTDKGYRLFVDRLDQVKPLSAAEKRAIATFLEGRSTSTTWCSAACGCSPQLTRQVAIVQYPTLSRSTVRHVEVVPLAPSRLLLVLILSHRPRRAARGRAARRRSTTSGSPTCAPGSTGRSSASRSPRPRRRLWRSPPRCPRAAYGGRCGRRRAGRGDVRPPLRRAGRGRRHREPRPLRRRLRRRHPADARGARGARRAPQAARRGRHRRHRDGAHRARGPLPGARLDRPSSPPATARATRRWPPSASWGRPAWTTQGRWRRCARWRATSPGSSTKDDPHQPEGS